MASYTYGDDLLSQTISTGTNFYGYDGLGSTKFLTDTNGAITDTYQYDAYGEITSQTGTTDNNYLYTGEQYDRSLNQYYLRARYYNQGVGRFTQMDTWQGRMRNPTTLNKYLYADANPVMHVDPSGNMSLGGLMAGLQSASNLASTVVRVAYTAEKAQTFLGFFLTGMELKSGLAQHFSGNRNVGNRQSYSGARGGLINNKVDPEQVMHSLLSKSGILLHDSWDEWGKYLNKNAKKVNRFVIYLPSSSGFYFEFKIKKVGDIDIKVANDPKGSGRVTGVGVGLKNQKKAKQIWRMDHHQPHATHNAHGDYSYFIDHPFHYHVNRAPK